MNANAVGTTAYTARPGPAGTTVAAITANPKFQELVSKRNALASLLSIIMMAIYLAFILLVAFNKPLLATKVAATTSLGIVLGLVVIVSAILLTGFYVARANGRFDELTTALVREHGQ